MDERGIEMGAVALGVSDLERSIAWYESMLGMRVRAREGASVEMGSGGHALLRLTARPGMTEEPGSPGLFHFAVLVPSRHDLGRALAHFVRERIPLQGVADHLVSEALYLGDPDGHGIEIYRDRPREEWSYAEGGLRMDTLPLDVEGILATQDGEDASHELAPETRMGHVHLRVSALDGAARFFEESLGLERMAEYPGALFQAADGYHHHIGANVWQSRGRAPRGPDRLGLDHFEIVVPSSGDRHAMIERAAALGYEVGADGLLIGMDGIACRLVPAAT